MRLVAFALTAFLLLGSLAHAAGVGPSLVQVGCTSAAGTLNCSLVSGVKAADLVSLWVVRNTASSLSGVQDDKSDTCTVGSDYTGASVILTPVYCPNLTAGAKTFTATVSGTDTLGRVIVDGEWSGVVAASPLDKTTGQAQTTPGVAANAVTSGSVTTTTGNPNELIVAATVNGTGVAGAGTITAGTGYTGLQTTASLLRSEYQVQTAAGAIAGTFTASSAADSFVTAIMTFLPTEQMSKLVSYFVLNATGPQMSNFKAFFVLSAVQSMTAFKAFFVMCTPPGTLACPANAIYPYRRPGGSRLGR